MLAAKKSVLLALSFLALSPCLSHADTTTETLIAEVKTYVLQSAAPKATIRKSLTGFEKQLLLIEVATQKDSIPNAQKKSIVNGRIVAFRSELNRNTDASVRGQIVRTGLNAVLSGAQKTVEYANPTAFKALAKLAGLAGNVSREIRRSL